MSIDLSSGKALAHSEPVFAFSQSDWDVCASFVTLSRSPLLSPLLSVECVYVHGLCVSCRLFQQTTTNPLLEQSVSKQTALLFTLSLGSLITIASDKLISVEWSGFYWSRWIIISERIVQHQHHLFAIRAGWIQLVIDRLILITIWITPGS